MPPMPDVQKPQDDPYGLLQQSWPTESESAYRAAETLASDMSVTVQAQSDNADDAARQTSLEMQGKTADAVAGGYTSSATHLREQSQNCTTIAAWMTDAGGTVRTAKNRMVALVRTGTSEIKDALNSELQGTPTAPTSTDLTAKYRDDIAAVKSKLGTDLDAIGHSLHGDPGASRTPSYVSVPVSSSEQHHHGGTEQVAAYNHGQSPEVTPQKLPAMPRAVTVPTAESPSGTSTPSAPTHSVNPTLANLIGGGQGAPTGTPSMGTPTGTPSQGSPGSPTHQSTEQRQAPRPAALPRIPSIPLDGLPVAAAESVATVVTSASGHQLSTAPSTTSTTITPSVPASTGITPGTAGTLPATPVTPTPLTPIGGGGLATPPVTQPTTPAPQAAAAAPPPAPQQTAPPRSPVVDAAWLQRTYGLAPGVEVPKSETVFLPALFIADLPEAEAHLHRALSSLRQAFESAGWSQPLVVASIRRGFEVKTVFCTADAISIHPSGVLLPHGVTPLDEMPDAPTYSELSGSLMVSEKLTALIPRGWTVQSMLSTVPSDEDHQSPEQYQSLVQGGEVLSCKVSRGRVGVTAEEALGVFARAVLGSAGCSDLDVESARLRAGRWVGVQPSGYQGLLARWYLSDAAESMSLGDWAGAVYCSERYLSISDTKRQVA
ncbi:Uncharacterised protein [Mycobacteroides abscessus subsp. abscessus]|nr:hypothetical protein [Mycobacteroides abscessus subsp. massiliense]SID68369.1 Uncharacterised protein [Mycobacteroides abscessus subsp. abscessus]SIF77185.1 Uncharacterised protein [Mycobacteroides abscessus subsp. abscessus]SIG16510.1 Uncharacterised protein [Mycobacteroides abscessus subsp. abscessus]SIH64314.1 Uncharacterised protein [Mycobacteroides abscessus subsp. abscessus]